MNVLLPDLIRQLRVDNLNVGKICVSGLLIVKVVKLH